MLIRQPVVIVDGARAAALALILRNLDRAGHLDQHGPRIAGELRQVAVELDAAGRAWLGVADAQPQKPHRDPDAAGSSTSPLGTGDGEWVPTREAAAILGISPQGLRKTAASRGGEFVRGRWLFPRCAIVAEQKRRAS
jgi:hypothetical protein